MPTIRLPHEWDPRPYQRPFWEYMERKHDSQRACLVWHRRAGKDSTAANFTAVAAHQRIGTYWHLLPKLSQARKVVWNGIDRAGRRLIDQAFPPEIRAAKPNSTEMKIELKCGSIWQVVGSDNYDSLIGSNPVGVVLSEYAVADPAAWDFIRPILRENGGWAVFIYTSRGRNHGHSLYDMARTNPDWFAERLTVDDTNVLTAQDIDAERREGMSEDMIQQEYYCSFDAPVVGAYYGKEMLAAEKDGRITRVPIEALPIHSAWDLGIGDSNAIWFYQQVGREIRLIDYYESSGVGLEHYVGVMRERGFLQSERAGDVVLPHDAEARELGSGRSRVETLEELGIPSHMIRVIPRQNVDDGINAVRRILPRCWFDQERCERGLDTLRNYHRDWDEKNKVFSAKPMHDWASHGADAFRTLAMGLEEMTSAPRKEYVGPKVLV